MIGSGGSRLAGDAMFVAVVMVVVVVPVPVMAYHYVITAAEGQGFQIAGSSDGAINPTLTLGVGTFLSIDASDASLRNHSVCVSTSPTLPVSSYNGMSECASPIAAVSYLEFYADLAQTFYLIDSSNGLYRITIQISDQLRIRWWETVELANFELNYGVSRDHHLQPGQNFVVSVETDYSIFGIRPHPVCITNTRYDSDSFYPGWSGSDQRSCITNGRLSLTTLRLPVPHVFYIVCKFHPRVHYHRFTVAAATHGPYDIKPTAVNAIEADDTITRADHIDASADADAAANANAKRATGSGPVSVTSLSVSPVLHLPLTATQSVFKLTGVPMDWTLTVNVSGAGSSNPSHPLWLSVLVSISSFIAFCATDGWRA